MKISRQALERTWLFSSIAAAFVFAVLALWDHRLKALSGFGTADLQGFSTARQYDTVFMVWPSRYAVRAGFAWGLDYLLMPLYAASFFCSGILAREYFAPRPGRLRRILTLAAAVPLAGALLDAGENALQLGMMLTGSSDGLAGYAFNLSCAKWAALAVGVGLFVAALVARFKQGLKTGT